MAAPITASHRGRAAEFFRHLLRGVPPWRLDDWVKTGADPENLIDYRIADLATEFAEVFMEGYREGDRGRGFRERHD